MYICIYYTCLYNIVGTQSSYYEMVKKKDRYLNKCNFLEKKKNPSEIVEEKIVITKSLPIKKDTSGTFYIKKQLGKSSSKLFFQ